MYDSLATLDIATLAFYLLLNHVVFDARLHAVPFSLDEILVMKVERLAHSLARQREGFVGGEPAIFVGLDHSDPQR